MIEPFTLFDREAGQTPVLRGDADHRIEDEQRDVAARDRFERTQRRVIFDRPMRFGLLAHAGGVDQANGAVMPVQERVDRVARRARNVGDDGALFAEQRVEQRTLADVGAADDRERELVAEHRIRCVRREQFDDAIEQIAGALTVDRRDRDRFAESKPRKFAVYRGKRARRFGICWRRARCGGAWRAELRNVFVERIQSDLRVDDEHDDVGFGAAASA